jgi:hypothetical protein
MYLVYVNENRTMKPTEIFLRSGEVLRENDGGMNLINIYCKHICKCHNKSSHKTIVC